MIFAPLKGSLARPWTSIAKTVPWRNRSATATRGTDVLLQSNPLLAPLENAACDEELPRPSLCKWHLMVQDLPWLKLAGWSQQWYCDTVIQIHMIHTTDTADLLCLVSKHFPLNEQGSQDGCLDPNFGFDHLYVISLNQLQTHRAGDPTVEAAGLSNCTRPRAIERTSLVR